jgi:hypothetical protein
LQNGFFNDKSKKYQSEAEVLRQQCMGTKEDLPEAAKIL